MKFFTTAVTNILACRASANASVLIVILTSSFFHLQGIEARISDTDTIVSKQSKISLPLLTCSFDQPCPSYYDFCDYLTDTCQSCPLYEHWTGSVCIECSFPDSWDDVTDTCLYNYYEGYNDPGLRWWGWLAIGIAVVALIGLFIRLAVCFVASRQTRGTNQVTRQVVVPVHVAGPGTGVGFAGQTNQAYDVQGNPITFIANTNSQVVYSVHQPQHVGPAPYPQQRPQQYQQNSDHPHNLQPDTVETTTQTTWTHNQGPMYSE